MKLVYEESGEEVKIGDVVILGRNGDNYIVANIEKPRHSGSTGRVYVYLEDGKPTETQGFYPGVIGAEWIEREDR